MIEITADTVEEVEPLQVPDCERFAGRSKKVSEKRVLCLTVGEYPIQCRKINETTMDQTTTAPTKCVLNGVSISLQNFGTRIAIFLQGKKEDIESRYYSLWNHECITGELVWWSDNCAFTWIYDYGIGCRETCMQKLEKAMAFAVHAELQNSNRHPKRDSLGYALKIARQRISTMPWVNWIKWEANLNLHGFGDSVSAEKPTGDFSDVLTTTIEGSAGHRGLSREGKELEETLDSAEA
jgi:hypothetical protein